MKKWRKKSEENEWRCFFKEESNEEKGYKCLPTRMRAPPGGDELFEKMSEMLSCLDIYGKEMKWAYNAVKKTVVGANPV